ncbi:hypothetical protein ACIBBB_28280 [Streptomyces sp. NPDC051217]|uniref:hypothetical protein n=1 Tax=Streptomyces sp. NPDC051217 TaxID=3365644 RepID=UPI0037929244
MVEPAPALRQGGQAVDFRGETHLTVLERMGLIPALRDLQTGGSPIRFVDERGRTLLRLPAEFAGGEIEVLRGDLAQLLYERGLPHTEYLFGDSISRADVDTWSTGRVCLVGDAACGATIGGMGSGTAMVAAYVLAVELARAGDDHRTAFTRYENRLRKYAKGCQAGGNRTGASSSPPPPRPACVCATACCPVRCS